MKSMIVITLIIKKITFKSQKLTRHGSETTVIPEVCAWQARARMWSSFITRLIENGINLEFPHHNPETAKT